mgnify:CR=1 FL=1
MGAYEDMMNEMSELSDANFNFEPGSDFEPQNADSRSGNILGVKGLASQASNAVKNPNTNNLANFNIQVSRPTRAIVGVSLPFVLFGYQEEQNLYKSFPYVQKRYQNHLVENQKNFKEINACSAFIIEMIQKSNKYCFAQF